MTTFYSPIYWTSWIFPNKNEILKECDRHRLLCKGRGELRHFPVQKSKSSFINSKSELLNLKIVTGRLYQPTVNMQLHYEIKFFIDTGLIRSLKKDTWTFRVSFPWFSLCRFALKCPCPWVIPLMRIYF